MLHKKPDTTALISSRICHDLISPIGAINNGLELMALAGCETTPEFQLVVETAQNANAKIQFLRIAFGAASTPEAVSIVDIRDILMGYFKDQKAKLEWRINTPLNRQDLKTLFLLLLCIEKIMPYGGQIKAEQTDHTLRLTAQSDSLSATEFYDFKAQRFYPKDSPAFIQFHLIHLHLDQTKQHLHISQRENSLCFDIEDLE